MDNKRKTRKISLGFLDVSNSGSSVNQLLDKLIKKRNALPPQNLFYSPTPLQKNIKLPVFFIKDKLSSSSSNNEEHLQKNNAQKTEYSTQNSKDLQIDSFRPVVFSTPAVHAPAVEQEINKSVGSSSTSTTSNNQFELAENGVERLVSTSSIEDVNNKFPQNVVQNERLEKSKSLNNVNKQENQLQQQRQKQQEIISEDSNHDVLIEKNNNEENCDDIDETINSNRSEDESINVTENMIAVANQTNCNVLITKPKSKLTISKNNANSMSYTIKNKSKSLAHDKIDTIIDKNISEKENENENNQQLRIVRMTNISDRIENESERINHRPIGSKEDNDVRRNLHNTKRDSKSISSKTIILNEQQLNSNNEMVDNDNDEVDEMIHITDNTIINAPLNIDKQQSKSIIQKDSQTTSTNSSSNNRGNKISNLKSQNKNILDTDKIDNQIEKNASKNNLNEKDNNIVNDSQSNSNHNSPKQLRNNAITNYFPKTPIKSNNVSARLTTTIKESRASNMIALQTFSNEINEILSQVSGDNDDIVEEVLPNSQPKWLLSAIENNRKTNITNDFKKPTIKSKTNKKESKKTVDPVKESYLNATKNLLQNKTKLSTNSSCSTVENSRKRTLHTKGRSDDEINENEIRQLDNQQTLQNTNNHEENNINTQSISNPKKLNSNENKSIKSSSTKNISTKDVKIKVKRLKNDVRKLNINTDNRSGNENELELNEIDNKSSKNNGQIQKSRKKINKKNKGNSTKTITTVNTENNNNKKQKSKLDSLKKSDNLDNYSETNVNEVAGLRRSNRQHKALTAYWINTKPLIVDTFIWQKLNDNDGKKQKKNVTKQNKSTKTNKSSKKSNHGDRNKRQKIQKIHLDVVVEENNDEQIDENDIQRNEINDNNNDDKVIIEEENIEEIEDNNPNRNIDIEKENVEVETPNSPEILEANGVNSEIELNRNQVEIEKNINFNPVVRIKRKRKINSDSGTECDDDDERPNQNQNHQTETIYKKKSEHNEKIKWINDFMNSIWNSEGKIIQQISAVKKASKVSIKDLCFAEHEGVEYAYYKCDTGYIRIRPHSEKKYSRTNSYSLKIFVLNGNLDFHIEEELLYATNGDCIDVEKGTRYKVENNTSKIALLLFIRFK